MRLSQRYSDRITALVALFFFLVLLPSLIWVPTLFTHADGVVSAAQAEGYNNKSAHFVTLVWAFVSSITIFFLARKFTPLPVASTDFKPPSKINIIGIIQLVSVGIVVLALYFPPALARYGPYMEESIHLGALHRMLAGDVPYIDFEFLYGPLMLFSSYFWTLATDFSLISFYSYVALLEIIVFLTILRIVQLYLSNVWLRLGAFLLIAALYFNPLVGPNQNGLRKIAGVAILLSVATRPWSRAFWVIHGIGVGTLLSYSQDFGAATALGIAAIYTTLFFKMRDRRSVVALAVIALVSALTWIGITWALLGAGTFQYFEMLAYLTGRFDAGEAAFRFYWTASSIAVFGLLLLAIWHVAVSFARPWSRQVKTADLIFVGGIVYALVMLKSGLSRADQWHLVPSVLVLVFAFILPIPSSTAPVSRNTRRIGIGLSLILSLSYSFGHYPQTYYVFRGGLVAGYVDLINSEPTAQIPLAEPARPALAFESSNPNTEIVQLSEFLAAPEQLGRRIFIYSSPWALPFLVGATKAGFLGDDYIYGDDRGEKVRAQLDRQPETLVVIRSSEYEWLLEGPEAELANRDFYMLGNGIWRKLRANISSVHVLGVVIEERLKTERWRRLIGNYIVETYHPVFSNDKFYVLARNPKMGG